MENRAKRISHFDVVVTVIVIDLSIALRWIQNVLYSSYTVVHGRALQSSKHVSKLVSIITIIVI